MPLDPSIGLQVQNTNPIAMIGGYLDLGQKQLQLDKSRQTFNADVAQRQAESSSAQTAADVAAQTAAPRISQAQSAAASAATQLNTDQLANAKAHATNTAQQLGPLVNDPDITQEKVMGVINDTLKSHGAPPSAYAQAYSGMPNPTGDPVADKAALKGFVTQSLLRAQTAQAQLEKQYPAAGAVSTGQQVVPVAGGNAQTTAGPAPGTQLPGAGVQMQIPPTATTMQGNQSSYVGPTGPQPVNAPPVPAGPALGQPEAVTGPVATNNAHYTAVQQAAQTAPTRIGVLQNIQSLSHEAATGSADTYKTVIAKLAGYTGWTGDKQTATDVMAKEAALLASQGGQTDLARTLNEAATPGGHMTEAAINQTAAQLIGQEKAKIAAAQYFQGTPTNSSLYPQKMQMWAQNGDPQAFEYASKSPADQATMKAQMQKAGTWNALRQHMVQLHMMGLDPQ